MASNNNNNNASRFRGLVVADLLMHCMIHGNRLEYFGIEATIVHDMEDAIICFLEGQRFDITIVEMEDPTATIEIVTVLRAVGDASKIVVVTDILDVGLDSMLIGADDCLNTISPIEELEETLRRFGFIA